VWARFSRAWLSLTPEPERELPTAIAVLHAGGAPAADDVRRERERAHQAGLVRVTAAPPGRRRPGERAAGPLAPRAAGGQPDHRARFRRSVARAQPRPARAAGARAARRRRGSSSRARSAPSAPAAGSAKRAVAAIRAAAIEARLNGGLHAPEHGGQGWSKVEWLLVEEHIGRSTNGLWWWIPSAYNVLAAGSPEQIDRYLRPALRGERQDAYAVTEEHAGSDPSGIATTAERTEAGWRINGVKWFVTSGGIAARGVGDGVFCGVHAGHRASARPLRRFPRR
jgi:hypothetical protein